SQSIAFAKMRYFLCRDHCVPAVDATIIFWAPTYVPGATAKLKSRGLNSLKTGGESRGYCGTVVNRSRMESSGFYPPPRRIDIVYLNGCRALRHGGRPHDSLPTTASTFSRS